MPTTCQQRCPALLFVSRSDKAHLVVLLVLVQRQLASVIDPYLRCQSDNIKNAPARGACESRINEKGRKIRNSISFTIHL